MIQFSQSFKRHISVYLTLWYFGLLLFCNFINAEERFVKPVSIFTQKKSLSSVLNQITQDTGYVFIYDQNWSDLPVTVSIRNLPIDKALRKILANHNSAIQYQENGHIIINIYENSDSGRTYVQTPMETSQIDNVYLTPRAIDTEEESDTSESAEDIEGAEVESPIESDETQQADAEEEEKPAPEDKQDNHENIESDQQEETGNSEESSADTNDDLNSEDE
jgi:hypothetical protein